MRQLFFLIMIFTVLASCQDKGRDPLLGFEMGAEKKDWELVLNSLIDEGLLIKNEFDDFGAYILNGADSFRVEYKINKPYPSSRFNIYSDDQLYQNGALRNIEIVLNSDTICGTYFGYRRKSIVDKIRKHLFNIYGTPTSSTDSLENGYKNDLESGAIDKLFGMAKYTRYIDGELKNINFIDTWELESMTVQMYREPYYYDVCIKDTIYPNAHIVFKMIGYKNEFERIQRKIKKGFGPDDMISIEFYQPSVKYIEKDFYGKIYELNQSLMYLSREGPEDKRLITDIKFDIVYFNRFDEEVARIDNCIYSFPNGLGPGTAISISGRKGYSIKYNSYFTEKAGYDYIRENIDMYKWDGKGEIVSEIKKVVFEDGSVLE